MANIYTDIAMFDAELYLAKNPDVAAAIEGTEITAQDHYFLHGAAESLTNNDRAPNAWFNAAEYKAQNPDLADVDANLLLAHFALHGVNEGRAPNAATAGEDGKIKPELLNDYVNAEGNADVKAAIAEMTGEEVGAELTAEQATIAMQHFFNHGINESREGGIADLISNDAGVDLGDIVKAVENYQDKLDAQDAAVAAQQKAADEAVKAGLSTQEKEDGKYDAAAVKSEVNNKIESLEQAVRFAADGLLPESLKINAESLALVKQQQDADLAVAQKQVDILKAANAPVVTLQEKLAGFEAVAKDINKAVIDFEKFADKFDIDNPGVLVENSFVLADKAYSVKVMAGDELTLTLTFNEAGKLVVNNADGEKASNEQVAALNKVEGIEDVKAALTAVQANVAKYAAAEKAIQNALVAALKAEGFAPYKTGDDDKLVKASWADAIKDGEVAADITLHTKVEKGVAAEDDVSLGAPAVLYTIPEFAMTVEAAAGKLGEGLPPTILGAADDSAEAVKALTVLKGEIKDFEEALAAYNEALELQKALADAATAVEKAGKAVETAEEAFDGLDINFVKAEAGVADGEAYFEGDEEQVADLFVFSSSLTTVNNFDGDDLFYFGDAAVALVPLAEDAEVEGVKLGGDANVLEIFAQQDGVNTVLYVEKAAFAGNSANGAVDSDGNATADFVKVTLTGVNADDLQLADGFLTLA